jgi:chromate transporter
MESQQPVSERGGGAGGGGHGDRALAEVAGLFLRLGLTAFGGPAAHIAMMHDEVVKRRKWIDDGRFLDLLGATNLIPGPNSTEMAIHIGYLRAGWPGLVVAIACSHPLPANCLTSVSSSAARGWDGSRIGSSSRRSRSGK